MIYRFSLSKYVAKNKTAYYNCFDSTCGARGTFKINLDNTNNINNDRNDFKNDEFHLTKKHTKTYEEHSYKINNEIKDDMKNDKVTTDKLENLEYYKKFLKLFCLQNISLRKEIIKEKFLEIYGNIDIKLKPEEKTKLINNYKKSHNITDEEYEKLNFKDIFNKNILFDRALNAAYKVNSSKKNIKNLILDMKDFNNYDLTTKLSVIFKRKNKEYKKDIFIIMNENMKKNIVLIDNNQFFVDTTFQCIPPQHKGLKLFVILTYNKKLNKTLLCLLALIYNENFETISEIFNFLKKNYNFYPKIITVDFGKAGYKAIQQSFPKTRIFTCYFHLIRRLIIHLKNIKSKNKLIRRNARNLLFNMKILIFIDNEKIEEFFELIKSQYYKNYKKFLDYFEKQYLKTGLFSDKNWNYSSFLKGEEDIQLYFFTNNVAETLNRTINNFYKNSRKTFYNFQNCINKIIKI